METGYARNVYDGPFARFAFPIRFRARARAREREREILYESLSLFFFFFLSDTSSETSYLSTLALIIGISGRLTFHQAGARGENRRR